MYRTLDGRLSSGASARVLVITTPGRRTGSLRSTCVRYLEGPEGLIVWGTGSGSRKDPDWFENLRQVNVADVQVRARKFQAGVLELVGADRDATWADVVLVQAPGVIKYAKKAGRTIPVAVLTPIEASAAL